MFIAIYNTDHNENKQGDIHSKNVWEFAPLLPHLIRAEIPVELDGKEISVSKIVDIAERWQFEAEVVLDQPRLDPHWNLNGSILSEEPSVSAWQKEDITVFDSPVKSIWEFDGDTQDSQPSVSGYWCLSSDPSNEDEFCVDQPTQIAWQNNEDLEEVVFSNPNDGVTYTQIILFDNSYEYREESPDTRYIEAYIPDDSYTHTNVMNPEATYFSEEVNDYRYTHLPEEYHWLLSEDTAAQAIADQEASDLKYKSLFRECREKWQDMADQFAFENSKLGITSEGKTKEVADAFKDVDYYLRLNSPHEAMTSLDLIPRGDLYLTEERLTALKDEFSSFLASRTN